MEGDFGAAGAFPAAEEGGGMRGGGGFGGGGGCRGEVLFVAGEGRVRALGGDFAYVGVGGVSVGWLEMEMGVGVGGGGWRGGRGERGN